MATFLFVDESGHDQQDSPCEVLAGVAVRDLTLWPLVQAIRELENKHFGMRYTLGERELKGKKILKTKVFRHADSGYTFASKDEQRELAKKALEHGNGAHPKEYAALAKAKLDFVNEFPSVCAKFKCAVFACMVPAKAPRPENPDILRKDYTYLFERFFYFLEDQSAKGAGIIAFDELEKSQSHILIQQMDSYFLGTHNGQQRSKLIVPEPFFVHSELTTGVQIADLVAYSLAWGRYRAPGQSGPARPELRALATGFEKLAYKTSRPSRQGKGRMAISSVTIIHDLRGRDERDGNKKGNVA